MLPVLRRRTQKLALLVLVKGAGIARGNHDDFKRQSLSGGPGRIARVRGSGFTVELIDADQVRIKPQCPAEWLPELKAAKLDIIQALMMEKNPPLFLVKESPQLRGLQIIPDDRRFIEACLADKTREEINNLLVEYRRCWLAAVDKEPARHRKENAGRCAANSWLRQHK